MTFLVKVSEGFRYISAILSATDTYNFPLAKWLDEKLKPLSLNQYTVTDNFDFTKEIHELKINKGEILVSYDVSSLFTNVPLDETIEILVNRAFSNNWFNTTHNLALTRTDLIDLLNVATKGQLFQFNGALYEQTDGVAMGSPLGPLLANVFMSSIEDTLERQRKLPSYYRRYVDDTLTVMPDLATATTFLHTLNSAHTSVKFTMEVEKNSKLPFLGTELLNHAPRIETKVYVKPTNTGLLLHYQSHVDNRYKRSLLKTMLDRAHRLSSSWAHFSDECDRLKKVFARLKYPGRLVNSTINTFLQSRIVGTQPTQTPKEPISIVRVVIPFKDQESANYVKKELKNLSMKVQTTVQPVFVSRKVSQDLKVREIKPQIVNQQRVVYQFQCDLCDAGYVGYTRGHLHTRVDGHKRKASSIYKHYHEQHSEVPKDLLKRFSILKKCSNKFDCLVNEMLFIRDLKPTLNVQSDSIRAKVFV